MHRITILLVLVSLIAWTGLARAEERCSPGMDRAIVMSGGGTKGAFEAGAAYHLIVQRHCDFKDFAGVSAGALNASVLAQAAAGANSWENLKRKSEELVAIWQGLHGQGDFMRPRVLTETLSSIFLVFGTESIFVFDPLIALIDKYVDPKLYASQCGRVPQNADNCRALRVGAVDFYTGSYAEFAPTDVRLFGLGPDSTNQEVLAKYSETYKRYILASALIPIFGNMPSIAQPGDEADGDGTWRQFADGGLRHATPVSGFFPSPIIRAMQMQLESNVRQEPRRTNASTEPGVIPPHPQVSELFIVLANPYDAKNDTEVYDDCFGERKRPRHYSHAFDITKEPDIVGRTLDIVLNTSGRWDINYALAANKMLEWRETVYGAVTLTPEQQGAFDKDFPVTSFNKARDSTVGIHYRLRLVKPTCNLTQGTYDFSEENVQKQLYDGCIAANELFLPDSDLSAQCDAVFAKYKPMKAVIR